MRQLIFILLLIVVVSANAQVVNWQDCQMPTSYNAIQAPPAPCAIEVPSLPTDIYVIKVGVYKHFVTSHEQVFVMQVNGLYHYYYNVLYTDKRQASDACAKFQSEGIFCDAYVTLFPFSRVFGFKSQ